MLACTATLNLLKQVKLRNRKKKSGNPTIKGMILHESVGMFLQLLYEYRHVQTGAWSTAFIHLCFTSVPGTRKIGTRIRRRTDSVSWTIRYAASVTHLTNTCCNWHYGAGCSTKRIPFHIEDTVTWQPTHAAAALCCPRACLCSHIV